jgi:hypothetical protein
MTLDISNSVPTIRRNLFTLRKRMILLAFVPGSLASQAGASSVFTPAAHQRGFG